MTRVRKYVVLMLGVSPALALADVTLYGQIRGGIEVRKVKHGDSEGTTTNVRDYTSRLGFKGTEDLGNGLKAIWQVEQSVSIEGDTKKGWSNRTTFVGLAGDWGKVRVGNLDNYTNSDLDIVDGWTMGSPAISLDIFTRYSGRVGPSIRYDTNVINGWQGSLLYASSDDRNKPAEKDGHNVEGNTDAGVYGLGLFYEAGPYFAGYAYNLDKAGYINAKGKRRDSQRHRLEAGYRQDGALLAVGYEHGRAVDQYLNTLIGAQPDNQAKVKSNQVVVTGEYGMGSWVPRVSYAHGFTQKTMGGMKLGNSYYNQGVIGADYYLSKRSRLLLAAGVLQYGKGDTRYRQTATALGMRHNF